MSKSRHTEAQGHSIEVVARMIVRPDGRQSELPTGIDSAKIVTERWMVASLKMLSVNPPRKARMWRQIRLTATDTLLQLLRHIGLNLLKRGVLS